MSLKRIMMWCVGVLLLAGDAGADEAKKPDPLRAKVLALNDVTGDDAIRGKTLELARDKDREAIKKLVAAAAKIADEKEQPLKYSAIAICTKVALDAKCYTEGEALAKASLKEALKLKSGKKVADALDSLASLYAATKRYDASLEAYQEILDLKAGDDVEKVKAFALERMIRVLARQEKYKQAMEMTERLIEASEGSFYFVSLKGELLRDQGKFDEAVATFEDAIKAVEKSDTVDAKNKPRYRDELKYYLSGVYTDMKNIDKAVAVLRELVKSQPERATYLNDLGYILADNNRELDEAEKLVRKALELERKGKKGASDEDDEEAVAPGKESSAYRDSLAWALFRKKNFAEAKAIMLAVVQEEDAQHVEIYDHLAEIQWALGEKADAIATWEKGIAVEDVTKRDASRKTAVKAKLDERKKQ